MGKTYQKTYREFTEGCTLTKHTEPGENGEPRNSASVGFNGELGKHIHKKGIGRVAPVDSESSKTLFTLKATYVLDEGTYLVQSKKKKRQYVEFPLDLIDGLKDLPDETPIYPTVRVYDTSGNIQIRI